MWKGFTLIELLAVIVILAIIALIAVPIVLQIIEDSNKSSKKESINMYAKAIEQGVSDYFLKNPKKKEVPELDELKKGGYINYTGNVDCKVKIYSNGKIYLEKCMVDGELVEYTYGEKEKTLCTLDGEKTGTEEINRGDKYKCEVIKGMDEPYTFYVLSMKGDKVNLIMDRNICEDGTTDYNSDPDNNYCRYAWYDDGDANTGNDTNEFGPVTAMTILGNATINWNNVPNMNLEYNDITDQTNSGYTGATDYGYTGITITNGTGYITKKDGTTQTPIILTDNKPIKARLPKYSEVYNIDTLDTNYCHYNVWGSCPTWIVENLYLNYAFSYCSACSIKYANTPKIDKIWGYWVLSSSPEISGYARYVYFDGFMTYASTSYDCYGGVRPVITLSKSDLSS